MGDVVHGASGRKRGGVNRRTHDDSPPHVGIGGSSFFHSTMVVPYRSWYPYEIQFNFLPNALE